MENRQNTRRLVVVLVLIIMGVVGLFGANYAGHYGKIKVTVHAIPDDSNITLNGSPVKEGAVFLKPGHYTFKATRKDFGPVQNTIDVHKKDRPQTIYLLPTPDTAAAIEFLRQHPEIQQQRERQGGVNSAATQTSLTKKYPILLKLPAYTSHYRIDYSLDSQQKISFAITLYAIVNNPNQYQQYLQQLQQYKAEALQFLNSNGIATNTVPITYTPSV